VADAADRDNCCGMSSSQVVLISGCSTGIGRALAKAFAARGHQVFATARKPETLSELVGPNVSALRLDVLDQGSIREAVAEVIARAGRIDMLVNNAGINRVGPLLDQPLDDLRSMLDTNVTGLVALTQAVFPHMARARKGRIVNIGSVVGVVPVPFGAGYCASKAAVHMLSDVMRMELKSFGIDVVVVQPGGVRSSIADGAALGIDRYARDDSPYREMAGAIERRAHMSQQDPTDADEFAADLVQAVTRKSAPRVVRLGRGARSLPKLHQLPGAVFDRIMLRAFRLPG
jgi:NAD(P)-dependent dehydrogenase (short-subunit alcohol dehydrogenase family)